MTAELLKPYVDLLTWQVIALLGGIFVLPALYIFVLRIEAFTAFGVNGKLKQSEATEIADEAEQAVEDEIAEGASPAEIISDAFDDTAKSPRERFKAAMSVHSALAHEIKDLAVQKGSQDRHASKTRQHLAYLRDKGAISAAQYRRGTDLLSQRNRWKRNSERPIDANEFESFHRRSKRLATELNTIRYQTASPNLTVVADTQT